MAVEQNWEPNESRNLLWKYYPKVVLLPPTKLVDEFELGKEKQKIIFKNIGGHSECSAYIHIPHEEMVILGDNIVGDPSQVGGCFFGGLRPNVVDIYKQVAELKPKTIVPGHGPITDLPYMQKALDYFIKFFKVLGEMIDKNVKPDEIATYQGLPEFYDKKPDYWDSTILRLYDAIGGEKAISEIDKIQRKLDKASITNDVDEMLKHYAKDFAITVSNGFAVRGHDDFRRCFRPSKYEKIEVERLDHFYLGNKIIEKLLSKTTQQVNGEKQVTESKCVNVWVKEDNKWKIQSEIRLDSN
jgi:ketosteroid isomerase-like protein